MSARDGRMATNGHTGNESLRITRVRGVPLTPPTGMGHRLIGGGTCLFNVNLTMPFEALAE